MKSFYLLLLIILYFLIACQQKTENRIGVINTDDDYSITKSNRIAMLNKKQENLPNGFKEFRRQYKRLKGSEYIEQIFLNSNANSARGFFSNTQIYHEKIDNYGGGGTTYNESFVFCADGTFRLKINSAVSVGIDSGNGLSADNNTISGVWDALYHQGHIVIMLYSSHPEIMQLNTYGFLPMHIKNYENDVVRITGQPKDKLYRRYAISCH